MIGMLLYFLAIIGMLLCFFAIPIGFWLFRVRTKKYLLGISILILFTPIILGVTLYLLRTPIQKGKFLSDFGPALSLFFPAEDLYFPLVEVPLSLGKSTYNFDVSHKYLGRHAVLIEAPSDVRPECYANQLVVDTINVNIKIKNGDVELFSSNKDRVWPYWSENKYVFTYAVYKVPQDVPMAEKTMFEIVLEKDLKEFLRKYENARFVVKKYSDL